MENIFTIRQKYTNEQLKVELNNYTSREFFIKYGEYVSIYFCFRYLYENVQESIHERVYYNEIVDKFKDKYSIDHIKKIYEVALYNKDNAITYKQIMYKIFCDGNCNGCANIDYCF